MKMDAYAWRAECTENHTYKIQVDDIKHGDKTTFSKLFKDWEEKATGWNIKKNTQVKIISRNFSSEKEWVEWAKTCPIKIYEIKYRAGSEKIIQRSCKTRKKRVSK